MKIMRALDGTTSGERQIEITIANHNFVGALWRGEQLRGPLALDTETHRIVPGDRTPPRLVLATASDGQHHVVIARDQMGDFVKRHARQPVVFHNIAFDVPVLAEWLGNRQDELWSWLNQVLIGDTLLLAIILDLFEFGVRQGKYDLGTLAARHTDLQVDKTDAHRLRFEEIDGEDLACVNAGFLEYALGDAIVTWRLHRALRQRALALLKPFASEIDLEFVRRLGPLADDIHAKAAVVLDAMSRRGVAVDSSARETMHRRAVKDLKTAAAGLSRAGGRDLFKREKASDKLLLTDSGVPRIHQKELRERLAVVAKSYGFRPGRTKTGEVVLAGDDWEPYRDCDPVVGAYLDFKKAGKMLQFFTKYPGDQVHPSYTVCVKTARTACSSPNIQQLPPAFRSMIVARPGHTLAISDYSFVELCTLSAHCDYRFGQSHLGESIKEGKDPHCQTASQLAGIDYEQFRERYQAGEPTTKRLRQAAKAVNFGLPGGLGWRRLQELARRSYRTDLTDDEALEFREQFLEEIAPEVGQHLPDHRRLAHARGAGKDDKLASLWCTHCTF